MKSNILWVLAGLGVVLGLALLLYLLRDGADQVAAKARRQEVAGKLHAALAAAADAEKSAVLSTSDSDAQIFARQARAASADVERLRDELGALIYDDKEKLLLAQFAQGFDDLQRLDKRLLELAGQNTNVKAQAMAFGPAAGAVAEMRDALGRVLALEAGSSAPSARRVMLLAAQAQSSAQALLSLLPPHIAEESDTKMDALEAQMAKEDQKVQSALTDLAKLLPDSADVNGAKSAWARFAELRPQIIKLSRANSNVRALSLSMNEKRKALALCQEALSALEQAIAVEPVAGAVKPR